MDPHRHGSSTGAVAPVDADEARAAASDRDVSVVEFFEVAEEVWTIVIADGHVDVHPTRR